MPCALKTILSLHYASTDMPYLLPLLYYKDYQTLKMFPISCLGNIPSVQRLAMAVSAFATLIGWQMEITGYEFLTSSVQCNLSGRRVLLLVGGTLIHINVANFFVYVLAMQLKIINVWQLTHKNRHELLFLSYRNFFGLPPLCLLELVNNS